MILQSRALENLEVRGTEYPPPPNKKLAAQLIFYLQLALFGGIFLGEHLFTHFKVDPPSIFTSMKDNKFASFMGIWLVGNMIQGSLLSTGAFEIYHGEKLIWSSLKEGRLPNMGDIISVFGSSGVEFMPASGEAT